MQCDSLILFSKQVFSTKMKEAVQEIRNTVTVNTSDISAKSSDDKDVQKDGDKLTRKKGGENSLEYLFCRLFPPFSKFVTHLNM